MNTVGNGFYDNSLIMDDYNNYIIDNILDTPVEIEPDIEIRLCFPEDFLRLDDSKWSRAKNRVIVFYWEVDKLPDRYIDFFKSATCIVCPNSYVESIVSQYDIPTVIIPPVVNDVFYTEQPRIERPETTFLYNGGWQYRKGAELVHPAFSKIFDGMESTKLIMKFGTCYGSHDLNLEKSNINFSTISSSLTWNQISTLYKSVDYIIQPSRGEGVGLQGIEGLLSGCKIISTVHTGITDYLTENNCSIIPAILYKTTEVPWLPDWSFSEETTCIDVTVDAVAKGIAQAPYVKYDINTNYLNKYKSEFVKLEWFEFIDKLMSGEYNVR
jgi:glycosyltransferase involved in cell wall biosynthesis